MNAQTSVSAMFDSAFENLAAPASQVLSTPAVSIPPPPPAVSMTSATPAKTTGKPIMKLALVVLATLGIAAALFLMFKKNQNQKQKQKQNKKTGKGRSNNDDSDSDADDDDEDEDEDNIQTKAKKTHPKPKKMTTFAPLDMPAVNFPVYPLQPSQLTQLTQPPLPPPTNIRNSKGTRASEQLQGFPPPNIDVGLGSGSPPIMRPQAPPAQAPPSSDGNFNPL